MTKILTGGTEGNIINFGNAIRPPVVVNSLIDHDKGFYDGVP
jgi:hypothetical protein